MREAKGGEAVADWSQAKIGYTALVGFHVHRWVADWSQAKIGYTPNCVSCRPDPVADWSQAKIGYTTSSGAYRVNMVADWSQAKIGYTFYAASLVVARLRIGLRPRLVTLTVEFEELPSRCGLVSGQDWLHYTHS